MAKFIATKNTNPIQLPLGTVQVHEVRMRFLINSAHVILDEDEQLKLRLKKYLIQYLLLMQTIQLDLWQQILLLKL